MPEVKTDAPVTKAPWSIFKLIYKKGNLLHELYFKSASQDVAQAKSREYCEKKSLRFINVSEWLKDIDQMINFEPDENWKGKTG